MKGVRHSTLGHIQRHVLGRERALLRSTPLCLAYGLSQHILVVHGLRRRPCPESPSPGRPVPDLPLAPHPPPLPFLPSTTVCDCAGKRMETLITLPRCMLCEVTVWGVVPARCSRVARSDVGVLGTENYRVITR